MKNHQRNETLVFCENVMRIREAHGLTPDEMANRLGVSKKTILTIERGTLPPRLSCAILFRIEREFGVSPKEMFASE